MTLNRVKLERPVISIENIASIVSLILPPKVLRYIPPNVLEANNEKIRKVFKKFLLANIILLINLLTLRIRTADRQVLVERTPKA